MATPLARWLRLLRQVHRRGADPIVFLLAGVVLVERVLAPIFVRVAFAASLTCTIAVAAISAGWVALSGLVRFGHRARMEAALYVSVVEASLKQNVLQASVLENEEARAAVFEGARELGTILSIGLPAMAADVLAALLFACVAIAVEPPRVVLVVVIAGLAGGIVLAASRGRWEGRQMEATRAWSVLADGVGDTFDGRLEIVAGGRSAEHLRRFAGIAEAWRAAIRRASRTAYVAGRWPVVIAAGLVGAAIVLDGVWRGESRAELLQQAALLASLSPPFLGVAHAVQQLVQNEGRLRPVLELLTVPPRAAPGAGAPPAKVDVLELRGVEFSYVRGARRHRALAGVSFACRAGELTALAGANGSGKSTCLRLLLGLATPDAGAVLIQGRPLADFALDAWRRQVAFLPQRPYLPPRATVQECLRFIDWDVAPALVHAALERVGLADAHARGALLDARVDELSVGQRQRVALARALCRGARVFVLDEPDANLDADGVRLVAALLRDLARGGVVIFAAHSPELLAAADRVLTLREGALAPP